MIVTVVVAGELQHGSAGRGAQGHGKGFGPLGHQVVGVGIEMVLLSSPWAKSSVPLWAVKSDPSTAVPLPVAK